MAPTDFKDIYIPQDIYTDRLPWFVQRLIKISNCSKIIDGGTAGQCLVQEVTIQDVTTKSFPDQVEARETTLYQKCRSGNPGPKEHQQHDSL